MRMHQRKKGQNNQEASVKANPVQAKLQSHVQKMDSPPASSQTASAEELQSQVQQEKERGFNFGEMPIFADAQAASTPALQPKFIVGAGRGKTAQQTASQAEPAQMKAEPIQRQEGEEDEPAQMKAEPIQRAEEQEDEPAQMKAEPIQRAEEQEDEPAQMKAEPIQRAEEQEDEPAQMKAEPIQRAEEQEDEPVQAKDDKDQTLQAKQSSVNLAPPSPGQMMPEPVQQKMEAAFDTDFSGVRIHEGSQAKAIGAVAYTQGSDIHFQPGKYQPETQSGQELLGHELTHVVQQRAGQVAVPQKKGVPINTETNLENEADVLGAKAAKGEQVQVSGTVTQRKAIHRSSINAQAFTTKNDSFFKQGAYNPKTQQGQEILAHELTQMRQKTGNTIQRKTGDLNSTVIGYHVTSKSITNSVLTGKTNTEIIRDNINKYNKIAKEDTNYKEQKKILKTIIQAGENWIHKRTDPSAMQKVAKGFSKIKNDKTKEQAIEGAMNQAATELLAVKGQEQNLKENKDPSKTQEYVEKLWGGVEGTTSEGSNLMSAAQAPINAKGIADQIGTLINGAKEAAETPAKNIIDSIINEGKNIFKFISKYGVLNILGFVSSVHKLTKVWSDFEAVSIARMSTAYDPKGNSVVQEGTPLGSEGKENLMAALNHGYGKVERRYYSQLYNVIMSAVSLANQIILIVSGFQAAPLNAVIGIGQAALNVITTLYRKVHGMSKLLQGKRGVQREKSATSIVASAQKGYEPALRLLLDFGLESPSRGPLKTTREIFEFLTTPYGRSNINNIKEMVAEKLKSQA